MRPRAASECSLLLAAISALSCGAESAAQCQYGVMQWAQWVCDWDGNRTYTGTGLNDLGAWCGYRLMCWPEEGDGWLPVYCPPNGVPQVLAIPAGASSDGAKANAVNNSGVVVGHMYSGSSSQFLIGVIWWPEGSYEVISPPEGLPFSRATDINDSGVIVGETGSVPYVLENGTMTLVPDGGLGGGYASRVSNSGDVIGTLGNLNANARGFRWKDGRLSLLEPLAGYPVSLANGVNSFGHVSGQSRTTTSPVIGKPTIWIDDEPIELPLPPGFTSGGASRINDAGIVFGSCSGPGVPSTHAIWYDGTPYLISTLMVPGSGSVGGLAALNEVGQLLGGGGPKLLTPVVSSIADLDGDCTVDGDDLGVLLASWGAPDFDPRCDFNGDGIVNGDDLGTLLGEWTATK